MREIEDQVPISSDLLKSELKPFPIYFWISLATFIISTTGQSLSYCYYSLGLNESFNSDFIILFFTPEEMGGAMFLSGLGFFGIHSGIRAWRDSEKKAAIVLIILNLLTFSRLIRGLCEFLLALAVGLGLYDLS